MKGYKEAQRAYDNMVPDDEEVCEICGEYECVCEPDIDIPEPRDVDYDFEPNFY